MIIAMTDRKGILKNSPLTYVLASVRFAPWPLMAKKIDEIHDQLRDDFPMMRRLQIQQIGLDGQVVSQGDGATQTAAWMFMPTDRSYLIQFAPEQLLILCKKYTRYTDFEKIFGKALDELLKHMRFVDIVSMGVRYIDNIKVLPEETLEDYISSGLLPTEIEGMEKIGGAVMGSYRSGKAELRIQSISQPGTLSVPQDLMPVLAMMNEPNTPLQLESLKKGEMFLDIDSIKKYTKPERMEKDDILLNLQSLKKEANNFFRHEHVCTEHAFKVWKGDSKL